MQNKKKVVPEQVNIWEVLPRDGFQMEEKWIPTEEKVRIIRGLASTGIKHIEVTSFVHPRAIPQLRDAEEVVKQVQDLDGVKFRALVPNLRGAERAINSGMKKIKILLSATDSHSLSNSNCLVSEAQKDHLPIVELARKYGVEVGGSIAVAFGCPYEGKVPLEKILSILEGYKNMGVTEVSLADTVGMGNPKQVSEMLSILRKLFPSFKFTLHLHNTRGMALANAVAALEQGVTDFDSSTTGLGGCPYAPNAAGNIPTEDLTHAFHEMGIQTGINLDSLLDVARDIKNTIGHDGGSFILKAGPNSRLHAKPKNQIKLG
ncbi:MULTISPECIES: hydroxymethylglutaryl-CoA lyase [unclassified Peribacillus]|uniref:hydroxymethylglutaryl-CoA lyase n=1 Tax=unclassified Peribacillus TaxID=2675266 RepID=UPI001913C775|nr:MULTISPECIES: hydroxymethylglutaryl-CoA lyase [unclassified Peribacillus]MBK5444847.1 hydroxymethylglutaryl-CoA lyase [Peribacillus sp. TH24]MBK5498605.1 hydroxymethylglutaryl-CoA lyase [Peribacillus sp. TH14]WMX56283.1 hydroxymethylglutaryl-CoA lyase [Peribacillus sp. R9-11]